MRGVRKSTGAQQLAVLDEVTTVGLESQRNAGRQLELVKTRLATFLDAGGASKDVALELVDLRGALDRINPELEQRSLWGRTIGLLPVHARQRDGPGAQEGRPALRAGLQADRRDRDEAPPGTLAAGPGQRRAPTPVRGRRGAAAGDPATGVPRRASCSTTCSGLLAETDDPLERDRIQAAVHDVATRLQDLHAMQEVHLQYFVSIELTRQNNNRLGQAVDRTLALATNVVTIGLAIQAALVRQAAVKEATERTREFLGRDDRPERPGDPDADRRDRRPLQRAGHRDGQAGAGAPRPAGRARRRQPTAGGRRGHRPTQHRGAHRPDPGDRREGPGPRATRAPAAR